MKKTRCCSASFCAGPNGCGTELGSEFGSGIRIFISTAFLDFRSPGAVRAMAVGVMVIHTGIFGESVFLVPYTLVLLFITAIFVSATLLLVASWILRYRSSWGSSSHQVLVRARRLV